MKFKEELDKFYITTGNLLLIFVIGFSFLIMSFNLEKGYLYILFLLFSSLFYSLINYINDKEKLKNEEEEKVCEVCGK